MAVQHWPCTVVPLISKSQDLVLHRINPLITDAITSFCGVGTCNEEKVRLQYEVVGNSPFNLNVLLAEKSLKLERN